MNNYRSNGVFKKHSSLIRGQLVVVGVTEKWTTFRILGGTTDLTMASINLKNMLQDKMSPFPIS